VIPYLATPFFKKVKIFLRGSIYTDKQALFYKYNIPTYAAGILPRPFDLPHFLFAACELMILFPRPLIKHFAKGGAFSAIIEQLNAAAI